MGCHGSGFYHNSDARVGPNLRRLDKAALEAVVKWSLTNIPIFKKGGVMVINPNADGTYTLVCANGYTFTGTYQECREKANEIIFIKGGQ